MSNRLVLSIAGIAVFGAGWGASTILSPKDHPPDQGATDLKLDRLDSQLDRIEASLASIKGPNSPPSAQPAVPDRRRVPAAIDPGSVSESLEAIQARLDELLVGLNETRAGLVELSLAKPEPDQEALAALLDQANSDDGLVRRLIAGMDYRDATRAFGTPTRKRNRDNMKTTSGLPVTEWLWDMPDSGRMLTVQFADGSASWSGFTSRTYLDDQ